jgi:eukaryotic-like serine/threonine-protein kinase
MNYGRYQVLEKLGEGTSGTLYKAHDPIIDRLVALKVLHKHHVQNKEFLSRFIKEAKAVGRLSHPGIVTVYDVGEDHGTVYIAMELIDGKPLDEVVKEAPLSLKEIVVFGVDVARALQVAHDEGIVHRDIKPANILISKDRKVKITDFGIARVDDNMGADKTQIGTILGTPLYMAPEQINAGNIDGRSDIYSLGVILYELVSGRCPFVGNDLTSLFSAITQGNASPLVAEDESLRSEQAKVFYAIVMKSLEKNPAERLQNADVMADALSTCLHDPLSEREEALPARTNKPMIFAFSMFAIAIAAYFIVSLWPASEQTLNLVSDPAGARVYIDSAFAGETPLLVQLPVGKYDVKFSRDKYYDWEAQVEIVDGQDETVSIPLMLLEE